MRLLAVLAVTLAAAAPATTKPRRHHKPPWERAVASVYGVGDGYMGGPFACGGRYTWRVKAVAHRAMRCGTKLELRYHGRRVKVVVRDRGPFAAGRTFDLTEAARRALRFPMGVDALRWRRR